MTRSTDTQDWTMRECPCGHRSCKQFTISVQGSVGFDEDDAKLIIAAPKMAALLQRFVDNIPLGPLRENDPLLEYEARELLVTVMKVTT